MRPFVVVALAAAVAPALAAQQPGPPPCRAEANRQFDFWIGTWDVFNPRGQRAGTNTIDSILGGCVLHEQWRGAGPSVGFSYNIYDAARGVWHQTWVDNSGTLLLLDGGLEHGSMVLSGPGKNARGQAVTHRITWTPITPDSVRQHWETSPDSGTTWTTAFDGRYVRRK